MRTCARSMCDTHHLVDWGLGGLTDMAVPTSRLRDPQVACAETAGFRQLDENGGETARVLGLHSCVHWTGFLANVTVATLAALPLP